MDQKHLGHSIWIFKKILDQQKIDKLLSIPDNWYGSEVGSEGRTPESFLRISDVFFSSDSYIYEIFWPIMTTANENAKWRYDITAAQPAQFAKYEKKGHYNFHVDSFGSWNDIDIDRDEPNLFGTVRKLSMTAVLTDDFEGGDLVILGDALSERQMNLEKGDVCFFPSFITHKISPITRGKRLSIVIWFAGPPFR